MIEFLQCDLIPVYCGSFSGTVWFSLGSDSPRILAQSTFPLVAHSLQPCPHLPHLWHWKVLWSGLNGPAAEVMGPRRFFRISSFLFPGEFDPDPEGDSFLSFFGFEPLKLLDFIVAVIRSNLFRSSSISSLLSMMFADFIRACPLLSNHSISASFMADSKVS